MMTWIMARLALLNAGLAIAGDYTETNQMPSQIHTRMETEGYAIDQKHLCIAPQTQNSLRNLKPVKHTQFMPWEFPAKKAGWSLWNNSSIKQVDRNPDALNKTAPLSLSQYELDINYSFRF